MKVGDTVYTFDVNRRVYRKNADGNSTGGPIFREHFSPWIIVGEEKRSWLIKPCQKNYGGPTKISKSKLLTAEQMEDRCWIEEHQYKLGRAVQAHTNVCVLKQIAKLVGYDTGSADDAG